MRTRSYLLLMLLAIIVPVAGLSILGLSMLLQFEREARLHTLQEVANSTSLLIDSELAIAEAALRNVANAEAIRNDNFAQLHRLLSATRSSALTWNTVAGYDGTPLLNTLTPYGTPLGGGTGPWAAAVYDRQKTRVSGYFVGSFTRRAAVAVDVPVPASFGKKYVVSQIFDPHYFNKVFHRAGSQSGWIFGLFDANGISIARNVNAEKFVGHPVRPELYAASQRQRTGLIRHPTRDGVEVYDIFVRSELSNWTVAIGVPVSEIESAARMTTWYAAAALLAVLGGAVGLAVYFARRIDRPLEAATEAAHALAEGKVAPATRSPLKEADVLLEALHRSSLALAEESSARLRLEHEREQLLERERAARKRAEAESNAKDTFISMLSHELRNPLAAINGAVTLIELTDVAPSKNQKIWDIVMRQFRHLTRMVDDLLDVRRVLSGKVTLQKTRVNVGAVLQFCCESRRLADAKQHVWTIETQEAWVWGDKTRLEQVIDNLLVNAIKFTPEGGSITVRNTVREQGVEIEVADSGAGMAPELLPTIFDTLVQGPTTIDRSQGGLGLGLSIARGLIQMHDGSISAHSEGLGKGSVFTVRLPSAAQETYSI